MKRILVAACAAMGFVSSASAQPVPVFNWSGFYIGGSVGYMYADVDWQYYNLPAGTGSLTSRGNRAVGAGHIGYQWQNGNYVYGLEASWQFPARAKHQCDAPLFCAAFDSFVRIDNLLTVGPRLGYAMNDRWLPYITGGYAVGQVTSAFYAKGFPGINASAWGTHVGWFVGAGVEYAYSRNFVIGVEYQHVDLSTELHSSTPIPAVGAARYISPAIDTVKIRLSLREIVK